MGGIDAWMSTCEWNRVWYKEIYFDVHNGEGLRIEDVQWVIEIAVLFYFGSLLEDAWGRNF